MKVSLFFQFVATFGAKIRFPIVGDWGGKDGEPYFTHAQDVVANMMNQECKLDQCDFMLGMG